MSMLGKTEADDLLSIDVYWLNRHSYFIGFKRGGIEWSNGFSDSRSSIGIACDVMDDPHIKLTYSQTDSFSGEKKSFDYKVRLVSTECNYGGKRWWFVCPLTVDGRSCSRRVGKLYKDGNYFGCRHCYDLTYSSKNINYNSSWYGAMSFIDIDKKIEKLELKTKRKFYAGKPTKNQQKLYKLYARSSEEYSKIDIGKLR